MGGPKLSSPRATAALTLVLAAASSLACTSNQALESLQSQIADLQRQVLQLQRQVPAKEDVAALAEDLARQHEALVKANADSGLKVDGLAEQLGQLEARISEATVRLTQVSQQLAATNQELKAIRVANEGAEGAARRSANTPQDPETLYRGAYNDYLRGNYDLAIQQFQDYIAAFPSTDLTDNAAYWLGECFYRQSKYRLAIGEFENLLSRFPTSDKLASALLKKGYAYLELNERAQGVVQLQHVIREYPGSDESNLARQRLRELGLDGG